MKGDESRPRLAVFRSVNHIYAQLINDDEGVTICSASTVEKGSGAGKGGNIDAAKTVGRLIAERAKDKGVTKWFSTAAVTFTMDASRRWPRPRAKPGCSFRRIVFYGENQS